MKNDARRAAHAAAHVRRANSRIAPKIANLIQSWKDEENENSNVSNDCGSAADADVAFRADGCDANSLLGTEPVSKVLKTC